jgi:hypothetical protein
MATKTATNTIEYDRFIRALARAKQLTRALAAGASLEDIDRGADDRRKALAAADRAEDLARFVDGYSDIAPLREAIRAAVEVRAAENRRLRTAEIERLTLVIRENRRALAY